jgi:SNF2 family DNA or RNA helicase
MLANDDSPQGAKHLKALAEITRLRQACCHPSLVEPKINIESAKLSTFLEIASELKDNGHRALVFSQFVTHLSIVRKALDKAGFVYQYLDGSTSMKNRETAVRNFQNGQGDLFLISLKAGGLGLNLTAADYVIHLDPWWNPAIEDQASDRAHRIGQNRPVTVYRLVAENTIEEKIIRLHNTKRELADSLLEGSDQSAKLSISELMALLKEE